MIELPLAGVRACTAPTVLALSAAACQPTEERPVTYIGDRAVVTFARPLCRGDIALIEQTLDHLEVQLDTKVDNPIQIWLWSRYENVVEACGEGPAGCYTAEGEIHGLWQSLEHELVHAVDAPLGTQEPLWSEGIAEALSGRTRDGEADVGSLVGLENYRQVDYGTAGHFVRWLEEEHGIEGVRALAREAAFEDAYGMALDDAIEDYDQNAPWSYPDWNTCRGGALAATEPEAWLHDIPIECDDAWGSARYGVGPSVLRTVDIEVAGTYRLQVQGANSISIVACQLDVLVDEPAGDMAADIIRESAGLRLPTMFVGDEEHEVRLEPGRLQLSILAEGAETTVGLELRRIGL